MGVRRFALIFGIIYLLVGLMGLVPAFLQAPTDDPGLAVDTLYGDLLGIFPVNIIHTLVHLLAGIGGILASRAYDSARGYSRAVGILFAVLFLMGLVPGLNTLFGLAPLHGSDVWLHLLSAAAALYFGFASRPVADTTTV